MPTIYRSDDAGAPVAVMNSSGVITILDACLVNGYGSKAPAGWTKEFAAAGKGVYRPGGSGLRPRLRVACSTYYAYLAGYASMSDVDTGTERFPSVTALPTGQVLTNWSHTYQMAWIVVAEAEGFYLILYPKNASTTVVPTSPDSTDVPSVMYFGKFKSLLPSDDYNYVLCAGDSSASGQHFCETADISGALGGGVALVAAGNNWLMRDYLGVSQSMPCQKLAFCDSKRHGQLGYGAAFPDVVSGQLNMQERAWLLEPGVGNSRLLRGYLPGAHWPMCNLSSPNRALDTFSGAGPLTGKTFWVVPLPGNASFGGTTYLIFNTSDAWGL